LKIFQNYLFAGQTTNSLTAYSEKLTILSFIHLITWKLQMKFWTKLFGILNKTNPGNPS